MIVSGDVFDIQYPSASVKKTFTEFFVRMHGVCPKTHIVITAGNHDSASRIQADHAIWELADVHLIGTPPAADSLDKSSGWQDEYIIKLDSGYIVALPYMSGSRRDIIQSILDKVAADNTDNLPVVMTGHQVVAGLNGEDTAGHNFEIGKLTMLDHDSLGSGYDYLALGHIHKPLTIDHRDDAMNNDVIYQAPVIRYSGSALHVSCDECYPHTVSLVEIDRHQGRVHIRQLRIDELRHFYVLPSDGSSFASTDSALEAMKRLIGQNKRGYIRFRFEQSTYLPPNFNQMVYDALKPYNDDEDNEEWRYNPKILWTGADAAEEDNREQPVFEVAELQQMTDPISFIERTIDRYPGLDLDDLRLAFEEIKDEAQRIAEENQAKSKKTTKKNKAAEQ